ncbi:MAG: riboflavin synthase [Planctomycetota bacterium]|nr:MAG: riboflavin synthase [Planctomycetota bacterium]
MFTGLVQAVGEVAEVAPAGAGRRLTLAAGAWAEAPAPGESIAVSGCCLTLAEPAVDGRLVFDVVAETLSRTTLGGLAPGARVNLERAARADSLLGGHIVQGHIDAVGRVEAVYADAGEHRVRFAAPAESVPLIVPKGSVAVDGVSLTVAAAGDTWFEVALIPTTLRETTLGDLAEGAAVNIETDILARAVAHWLRSTRGRPAGG